MEDVVVFVSPSRSLWCRLLLLSLGTVPLELAQDQAAAVEPSIQDNSFLIEEAYNQEPGVIQHITTFARLWNAKDWNATLTEEFPGRRNPRNQYSYTLVGMHAGGFEESGVGFGDLMLNYRYQLVGNGDSRVAFAPRLSVVVPTGDVTRGRGSGGTGVQTNLPLSVVLHRRLVSHWNAGSTFIPRAQGPDHSRAGAVGYNLGASLVYLLSPRVNFLVEVSESRFQSVVRPGGTEWTRASYLNPGIRWAYNFKNGSQIVPGVAVPIGIASSYGEAGIFLYLSFEHPFRRLYPDAHP